MTLQEKVLKLKLEAAAAGRLAMFWEKQIHTHGEHKATAFYTHLGLNHIERKGIEWEGLTLSRIPTPSEMLCVKGIATAQDTAKEQVEILLLGLRSQLIKQGLEGLEALEPATYHTLILTPSEQASQVLRERLATIYKQGRALVATELRALKAANIPTPPTEVDLLADLTTGRIANDVQSRITAAAARYRLMGLEEVDLFDAVEGEIQAGTVSYINRASIGLANRVISMGRSDEAEQRHDQWERVEYSALLDQNVCEACAEEDGQEAANENDLQPAPNPQCEGSDLCRCFHVFIAPEG